MLMSMVGATAEGHEGVWKPMGWTAARDHIGVHGQCPKDIMLMFLTSATHKGLQWCLWLVLYQRSVLMSVVCTVTRDYAEVRGTCRC